MSRFRYIEREDFGRYGERARDLRDAVTRAFRVLHRDHGFMTRSNFSCCGGCAGAEMAQINDARPKEKQAHRGVFYHRQSTQGLKDHGVIYLNFGGMTEEFDAPEFTVEAGKLVVAALKAEGVDCEWKGGPYDAICCYANGHKDRVRPAEVAA